MAIPNIKDRVIRAEAVTKSDTAENRYDCLFIGGSGNLVVVLEGDPTNTPLTYYNIPNAYTFLRAVKKVMDATTCTGIVGEWIA
jgi:hypothetical protein